MATMSSGCQALPLKIRTEVLTLRSVFNLYDSRGWKSYFLSFLYTLEILGLTGGYGFFETPYPQRPASESAAELTARFWCGLQFLRHAINFFVSARGHPIRRRHLSFATLSSLQDPASLTTALSDHLTHKAEHEPPIDGTESGTTLHVPEPAPQKRGILSQGSAFITDTSATNQVCCLLRPRNEVGLEAPTKTQTIVSG